MRKILLLLMVLFLSLILFACSQTNKYTLKFNTNGGNYIESIIVSGEQSDYSVPTPTKEGYTFVGWYTDNKFIQEWDGKITANLTIFAKWEINSYTLSYVTNCDELFDNVVLKYDDKLPSHQSPYKEGYTFVGWYLDEELTKPNDLVKMPANDVTLYAKYNANSCQIKFVVDDIAIKTIFVDYDSKITETEIPTNVDKKGYTLVGWELNGESYDFDSLVNGSLKLVAKFEVNTYKLRFNVEGVETVVEYKYGVSINPINNPSKSGHTFVGWTVLNNETGEYEEFSFSNVTMPDHDIILYAKWNINKYNIDFVLNSGIGEDEIKGIEYNSTNYLPADPTRDGYQFVGWYTDSECNNKFEDIYMPAKNLVLYAKWEANNYRVIFDGNGASGEMNSVDFVYATPQKLTSNQFVKVGHTFKGWSLEKDGEVKYLNEASVNNLTNVDGASVTLYAVWQINQYSITFEVDGKEVAVITQDYGTAVVAPEDPTKEGYTFNGWDNEIPSTMPAENLTFVAQFSINKYSITFKVDDEVYHVITLNYHENITLPNEPTKEGNTFAGWDTTVPSKMPAEDLVINAQWTANTYKLTVVFDNGEDTYKKEVVYGMAPEYELPTVVKTGYTFAGWNGNFPTTMPASDVTITALWTINQYSITFDSNGGSPVDTIIKDYGSNVNAPVAPTKEGHRFAGWMVLNPETSEYEEFSFVNYKLGANDVNLVAAWNINSYKLTIVYNNGTLKVDTVKYKFGDLVDEVPAPKYEGFSFDYWRNMTDGVEFSFENFKMPAKDIIIMAMFENIYTISFVTNSDNVIAPISGTKDQDITSLIPAIPTKDGYEFIGWTILENDSYVPFDMPTTMPGRDITLYADWTPITYTVMLDVDGQTTSLTATFDKELLVESPTKEGYTFAGWSYKEEIYFDKVLNLSSEKDAVVRLTATWTINQYSITFMVDNNIYHSITNEYGAIITTPKDPSKLGYRFIEWDKEIPSTTPAEDLIINAVFEIKQITITFIVDEEVYYTYTNNYGTAISAPANPSKEGYSFVKWDNTIPAELPAEDLVLTAIFEEHHYSITFNSNEGTVVTPMEVMENIAFTSEFNLPANGFRRNYYHFVGWSKVRNGVVEYTNEELVSGLTANDDENVILYAVWEINTYSIVFNANGADGAMAKQIFTCNQEQKLSINSFVKEGYRFIGWAISSAANAPVVYDDNANISENLVEANGGEYHLYAVWEAIEYNVTYVHGYKDSITVKSPYDQLINLSVEDREGYTFDAWYLDSNFSEEGKVTSITVPVDGVTLYAKWNINYHYVTINLGASHKIAATTLSSEPLYLPYNTNLSKYLSDNNYVLDRKGNTKTIKLGEEDITSGFNMYTIGDNDVVINVSYTPISYIVKFIIDDNLLFANQYTYGTALTYADVKADLKLKRDTLHELLGILRTFIISEGKQGTDAFMAFALTSDLQLSQKSLIINSLVVYNDPTYNLLVSYYNELFAQNFSHLTTLFEFVSLAEESFTRAVQSEPKLDGQIFTGWVLGSNTYYLDSIPGDPYQDAVPSGSNGVSNVVANFIDAPALELTANDFKDKTLSWESQWNAFVRDYLVEYYGYNADSSLSKVSYNVSFTIANYNSVSGRTDELGKTNDLSYTFMTETTHSIPGNYDVFVKANVNVYNKEGVEIANFETALGDTVRVSLSPEVNSGNLTSSGEYFYIFERLGVNYLYIFTNSTYSFDNKFDFGNVINYEYSYEKLITVDEVAYANGTTIITTNNLCGDFKIYAPQADNTVKEYYVRVLPLVNKFTFDESLSDYKYAVNSLNDIDTYLDKEAKPYMIGNSVSGMTISEYPNNGVKLDVYTLTNTNQTIDKNLFAGYLNYIFYVKDTNGEWIMLQDAELDSFVKYNSTYDTYEFNGEYDKRYKLVVEFGEYCIPQALINFIKPIELEFVVNDCINVYSHDALQRVYANLNYQNGINIHSNIEAVLTNIDRYTEEAITGNPAFELLATISYEEHKMMKNNKKLDYTRYFTGHIPYAEYWQTKDSVPFDGSPINMVPWELHHLYTKAYLNYKDEIQKGNVVDYYDYIATFRTGNVYMRAGVVDPNYQEQYEINGNYFEIDGSKLGYMSVNSISNLSKIDGYLVPNGYASMFAYYVHSNVTDYNSAMTNDYEHAYAERYVKNSSNVIFNNVTIQSNTSTTHEAGSDLTSSAIAMMNRNAGGYIGVTAGYGCGLITNNTIIRGATLGLAARWESELTMNYTTILSSWANPVYLLDAGNVNINTSYIRDSGGSAIYVEDSESVITGYNVDANGKVTGPKYEGFVTDNYINVDLYTKIENFIVGTEGYYNAYGMTTQVTGLKGQLEPVLNSLEGQKLTSIEKKENYLGQKVEMINFVYMACVAGKHGDTANSKNVLPICHTKINIQSYAITQTGINVGTVTQSGATHPHFGNQMVLRNIDSQTGNFDGYLLLTYDVPGKGKSVLGLGVKPYNG